MGTFNTKKTIYADPDLIPAMAERICREFQNDEYEVQLDSLLSGGCDISISKGDVFDAIVGTKTALKITLIPQNGNIAFEAGVGIFGQRIVPVFIVMLIGWPLLTTQIWGIVQQSKLDDKAYEIAKNVADEIAASPIFTPDNNAVDNVIDNSATVFCTVCGNMLPITARFCSNCGNEQNQHTLCDK